MKIAKKITLSEAIAVLHRGATIAHPTESCWGLGCDPHNPQAIRQLLRLKKRNQVKGLILVAGSWQAFAPSFPHLGQSRIDKIATKETHPCTWLIEDKQTAFSPLIKGNHHKIAIRITHHKPLVALTKAYGKPIVSTSANPANQPPAFSTEQLLSYFGDRLHILEGQLGGFTKPSHIRDLSSGKFIRS